MLNSAFDIIEEIHSMGFTAHIVGGAVRDLILGMEPHDIDICTNAPLEVLEEHWPSHDIGKSKTFGIITVEHNGFDFEVANFRTESTSSNGRHPDEVKIADTFEEDASRRDLTVNSLALDVDGNIIDFFNGREHLQRGLIKTVGDPNQRFEEDFLRIIRSVRFASRLGFTLECETERAIMECSCNLPKLSAERIHDELFKMASLGGKKFAHSIETMNALGILDIILPEIAVMKNFTESPLWHPEAWATGTGTVFDHTMQALRQSPTKDALTNIAILLHDVAKPVTAVFKPENGGHSFHGHDMASIPLIKNISKRLKFSTEETEAILFCATNHMKMHLSEVMKATKIVPMVTNKNWEMLKIVSFCDDSSRRNFSSDPAFRFNEEKFNSNINRFEEVAAKWSSNSKPTKIVDGNMVMEITSLKPSRELGNIITRVTEMVLDENRTESVEELIKEAFNDII